jgi:hypothetical protein
LKRLCIDIPELDSLNGCAKDYQGVIDPTPPKGLVETLSSTRADADAKRSSNPTGKKPARSDRHWARHRTSCHTGGTTSQSAHQRVWTLCASPRKITED